MEENQESEKIFHEKNYVIVSQSRYLVHGKTYAMRNISSVDVYTVNGSYAVQIIILLIGLVLIAIENARIIGAIIKAISILLMALVKDKYAVRISTNAGEVNNIISKDMDYVQQIVNALNDAMIYRG